MFRKRLLFLPLLACVAACDGSISVEPSDAGPPTPDAKNEPPFVDPKVPPAPVKKLDLLLMIDNSASMGDKQDLLRQAIPDMISRLVRPNCVDANDAAKVIGPSQDGQCASGVLEFKPVTDLHVGIVTSSLGGRGADACPTTGPNSMSPVNPSLDRHNDDRGRLINRAGANETALAEASPSSFLSWLPDVPENAGKPSPVPAIKDPSTLIARTQDLVSGVHEYGCGFEAQLESWYRFLVQPDPYDRIERQGNRAVLVGVDDTLLRQRKEFLRPDSAVAIVVFTDENDSTIDPLAIGGQAWVYENSTFPDSTTGHAPKATSGCAADPNAADCTSCALDKSDPACAEPYYRDPDDNLNLRFFHMKRRFGLDPQFPVSRYVNALLQPRIPDREGEHPAVRDGSGNMVPSANYVGKDNCTNPLFAKDLPADSSAELCNLALGPRKPNQVFFAVVGGVPSSLAKTTPSPAEWNAMIGKDPLRYDFTSVDPHMLESTSPRGGLPPPSAANTADPIHGREYNTNGAELQYACTFALPVPKDCRLPSNTNACDCYAGADKPVCDPQNRDMQVRAKAYPSIRELAVARGVAEVLPNNVVVSSICPARTTELEPGDPLYGYRPTMSVLIDKIRIALAK